LPVFEYEALSEDGRKSRGIVDAESEAGVRSRLRSEGQYPVKVEPAGVRQQRAAPKGWNRLFVFERIKSNEINVFTRQLATLIGAGIPLDSALASIVEQTDNSVLKKIIAQIKESVGEGQPLSSGIQKHPRLFSNMYVNMVRAGEAFGSLDQVLSRLADFGEKFETVKAKIRSAMIYPAFMTVIGAGVLLILITFVVPDIMQVYDKMERALPLPTQILIALGSFLQNYWWALLLCLIGVGFIVKKMLEQPAGRRARDFLLLKTPVIGGVIRKNVLFKFSSTLESLLGSGVDIVDSLEISKRVVDNVCIGEVIDEAIEEINVGQSMTGPFARSPWFPPMFVQMIGVGEASGQLEAMLEKIGTSSERDLESSILGLTALIEPILIVTMGVLVGFIVLSILLPIFEMNQVIG